MSNMGKGKTKKNTLPPPSIEQNCRKCSLPDDHDNLVGCDRCKQWYHYSCANVTDDINEAEEWFCQTCAAQSQSAEHPTAPIQFAIQPCTSETTPIESSRRPVPSTSGQYINESVAIASIPAVSTEAKKKPTSKKSVTSSERQTTLQLRRLEEERKLREERDTEYLNKKYAILEQFSSSDDSGSEASYVSRERVQDWVVKEVASQKVSKNNVTWFGTNLNHASIGTNQRPGLEKKQCTSEVNFEPQCVTLQGDTQREPSHEFSHRQPVFRESSTETSATLSRTQMAARHVMSKEQILFSGRPEEWPMFISWWNNSTSACGYNKQENLLRLQRCLKGRALESVRCRLLSPEQVDGILATLRMLYGRPETIIQSLLHKIRSEPAPKSDRLDTVINFSLSVGNLCSTMEATGLHSHLNNPCLLNELVEKLPNQIKLNWGIYKQSFTSIDLSVFNSWLSQVALAASEVTFISTSATAERKSEKRAKAFVNLHETSGSNSNSTPRCVVCKGSCKSLVTCETFKGLDLQSKWSAIKRGEYCRTCLWQHGRHRCTSRQLCGVDGCTYRHNRLLHKYTSAPNNDESTDNAAGSYTIHRKERKTMLFKILPITLYYEENEFNTFAFLDDGSSVTLIDEEVARALNAEGAGDPLCLNWTGDMQRSEESSIKINLKISEIGSNKKYALTNVNTVRSLSLPIQTIDAKKLASEFEHLRQIPIKSYEDAKPRILIGLQHWHLGIPQKTIEDGENKPVAIKTRLGWTAFGALSQKSKSKPSKNNNYNFHICECQKNDIDLHTMIKNYFAIESVGTKPIKRLLGSNDEQAVKMLDSQCKFDGIRYSVPLLWKYNNIALPDSRPMAEKRLKCLDKRLQKDPLVASKLEQLIEDYVQKGYAMKLCECEIVSNKSPVWYLPIFPVLNANKPNKIRLVWDAAAEVNGISLNSALLSGPDIVPVLTGVLYRFRERRIALAGDIREMFHQIGILKEDQDALRFLWRNKNGKIDTYRMMVMTFGATCSPYCAQYIKNKNAKRFSFQFPRATKAILENHYVDDLLDSVDTEEEAIKLANEVTFIHAQAGFEIRNFMSNSPKVLQNLKSTADSDKGLAQRNVSDNVEKLLGMWWSPSADTFTYSFKTNKVSQDIITGSRVPTKREVLKTLMSVFDPLGLIANFTIILKIVLQEIWRSSIEWDEQIKEIHFKKWVAWLRLIPVIKSLTIRRSYLQELTFREDRNVQLHVFVDASESAYAAVAYFRVSCALTIECGLVSAKTKVGPIKPISIPRMELEAAVLGTRLAKSILSTHSVKVNELILWSDSRVVLCWIKSEHRKYKTFVAFRVGEILEETEERNWRWVSTKENVADDATKHKPGMEYSSNSRWYRGPEFLYSRPEQWPQMEINRDNAEDEEELRGIKQCCVHVKVDHKETSIIDFSRFSKWTVLVRAMIFVFRYIGLSRKTTKKYDAVFSPAEIESVEHYLHRRCQIESFPEEYELLRQAKQKSLEVVLNKSSALAKLSPYMDEYGVLRIKGRIDAAQHVTAETKRPIILDRHHYLTHLIVRHYHIRFHHMFSETVVNEIRQRYFISHLRVVVRKVQQSCQFCKNMRATPIPPIMADLPLARLKSFTRPFSYVGIDYFGPIYVTVGRRREKRWGMLITCLTIRAIHIEIAHTLSSDSCILGLQRFFSRRGTPIEIYSDNGTNFRGASEELKKALKELNKKAIAQKFQMETKWHFIPPLSPHMGGSWERLVRSVKVTLAAISVSRNPSDESLLSMMAEVESVVNTRPLSYVPIDDESSEALTPNHLILGSSSGKKIFGELDDAGMVLRRNWRLTEQYANRFWHRWVNEYLPDLTRRTKWFSTAKPIAEGDIVVIVDSENPRNNWPKGKVIKAINGKDGVPRSAVIQTQTGFYTRPVVKLAVLDVLAPKGEGKQ